MSLLKPVLHAEDDPDDVFFLQHAWERAGIPNPLIHVPDGQRAIDYLVGRGAFADREKHPLPCLLLLDLSMPGISGFEVLEWVRKQAAFRTLKAVVISGSNQEKDVEFARRLGAIDYVVKPSGLVELQKIIEAKKERWLSAD
jgi:CheY-like chemotaxis protein